MKTNILGYSLTFSHTIKILCALISFFMLIGCFTWLGTPVDKFLPLLNANELIPFSKLLGHVAAFMTPYIGNYSVSLSYIIFGILFFLPSRKILMKGR